MWPWSKRPEAPLSEEEILGRMEDLNKARQDFERTATKLEAQLDRTRIQIEVGRHSGEAPFGYLRAGERHASTIADRLDGVQKEIARLTSEIGALEGQGRQAGIETGDLLRAQGIEDPLSPAEFDRRLGQGAEKPGGKPGGGSGGTLLVMFTDLFERGLDLLDRAKARPPADTGGAEGSGGSMPDEEGAGGHAGGVSETSSHDLADASSDRRPGDADDDDFLPPDGPLASPLASYRLDEANASFEPPDDAASDDFHPPGEVDASYPPDDVSMPPSHGDGTDGMQQTLVPPDPGR